VALVAPAGGPADGAATPGSAPPAAMNAPSGMEVMPGGAALPGAGANAGAGAETGAVGMDCAGATNGPGSARGGCTVGMVGTAGTVRGPPDAASPAAPTAGGAMTVGTDGMPTGRGATTPGMTGTAPAGGRTAGTAGIAGTLGAEAGAAAGAGAGAGVNPTMPDACTMLATDGNMEPASTVLGAAFTPAGLGGAPNAAAVGAETAAAGGVVNGLAVPSGPADRPANPPTGAGAAGTLPGGRANGAVGAGTGMAAGGAPFITGPPGLGGPPGTGGMATGLGKATGPAPAPGKGGWDAAEGIATPGIATWPATGLGGPPHMPGGNGGCVEAGSAAMA